MLGRPLGSPGDKEFQHRVLDAALGLLTRTDGPVFSEFLEEAMEVEDDKEDWVCPVSFDAPIESSPTENIQNEIAFLRPWYERGKVLSGRTSFGVSGLSPLELGPLIYSFLSDSRSGNNNGSDSLKLATDDLKAFYVEAAIQQPGFARPGAIENWYWNQTSAGELVKQVSVYCQKSSDATLRLTAKILIVPETVIPWT